MAFWLSQFFFWNLPCFHLSMVVVEVLCQHSTSSLVSPFVKEFRTSVQVEKPICLFKTMIGFTFVSSSGSLVK